MRALDTGVNDRTRLNFEGDIRPIGLRTVVRSHQLHLGCQVALDL